MIIRPEEANDFEDIKYMVIESFQKGTDYSDGSYIIALIDEIPQTYPECMMIQELYEGSLKDISGYIDYSMYDNLS